MPDQNGVLRCAATKCLQNGNSCTTHADCCSGGLCIFNTPGSSSGICGVVQEDGGIGGGGSGGTTGTTCSAYGQVCTTNTDCCTYPTDQCLVSSGRCGQPIF